MIRIILADDHAMFRQSLARMLEANDNIEIVAQAGNGVAALNLVKELKPHVVILDITMPEGTGIEVAEKIKEAALSTRVILLTTHDDPSLAVQGEEAGVVGHVLKENSVEELLEAVQIVNSGKKYISSSMEKAVEELKSLGSCAPLSPREKEVLHNISSGLTSKEIARKLDVSPKTVETHLARLKDKLGLRSRSELIRYAIKSGISS
ncbi:MAG: response regulator transcription factor [Magnetococcales bacterium]|nr:response regulator transcription factor [Magnetococcales bacterium]